MYKKSKFLTELTFRGPLCGLGMEHKVYLFLTEFTFMEHKVYLFLTEFTFRGPLLAPPSQSEQPHPQHLVPEIFL